MGKRFVWKLKQANEAGQLAKVQCQWCNTIKYFYPRDLMTLLGDAEVEEVERAMRCQQCKRGDYMVAEFKHMSAGERQGIRVRRLAKIKMVRKVIWADD
jgi:hypothetical protein